MQTDLLTTQRSPLLRCYYASIRSIVESDTWRSGVRPSVSLSHPHVHRDSPGGSMRRSQRTFGPDSKEDRHTQVVGWNRCVTPEWPLTSRWQADVTANMVQPLASWATWRTVFPSAIRKTFKKDVDLPLKSLMCWGVLPKLGYKWLNRLLAFWSMSGCSPVSSAISVLRMRSYHRIPTIGLCLWHFMCRDVDRHGLGGLQPPPPN